MLVRVSHSTVNYKDGLALTGKARRGAAVSDDPRHRPLRASSRPRAIPIGAPGDAVILNGWGLGETHFGGYAGYARVKGEWLVRVAEELHPRPCDGDRHGRIHGDALRAGARKARAHARRRTGRRHRRCRRRRIGRDRASRQARLARHRLDRPASRKRTTSRASARRRSSIARSSRRRAALWARNAGSRASTASARTRSRTSCR